MELFKKNLAKVCPLLTYITTNLCE